MTMDGDDAAGNDDGDRGFSAMSTAPRRLQASWRDLGAGTGQEHAGEGVHKRTVSNLTGRRRNFEKGPRWPWRSRGTCETAAAEKKWRGRGTRNPRASHGERGG